VLTVICQKRLKKERRARKQIQDQLDLEIKRRTQLEDALKATGASPEQVRAITGNWFFYLVHSHFSFIEIQETFFILYFYFVYKIRAMRTLEPDLIMA
jgi:uncharacterized protein YdaL